jgi:transcriptional regulator of acetoin/glycerol metabolism
LQYATDRPDLPESSIVAPVVFDGSVIGVLAVQSYRPHAYDEDDLALVQGVADQVAVSIARSGAADGHAHVSSQRTPDVEAVMASMPDAVLVLDHEGRLVRLNQAARLLLSAVRGSVIFGHPVDCPQADRWPLGTRALTQQLRPIVDQLRRGAAPNEEIQISLGGRANHKLSCKASVLLREGAPAGGLIVLRELAS